MMVAMKAAQWAVTKVVYSVVSLADVKVERRAESWVVYLAVSSVDWTAGTLADWMVDT